MRSQVNRKKEKNEKKQPQPLKNNLRTFRKKVKLSQAELAGRCGLKENYISDIEDGTITEVPADILARIGRTLGVTIADLCALPIRKHFGEAPPAGEPLHYRKKKGKP